MDYYFFSGNLSDDIFDILRNFPGYEPIDVLVTQLDRSSLRKMYEYKAKGWVNRIFVDSGAFSFHTGKAKLDIEDYINYLNEHDDDIFICAQVDTIPGKFSKPKSKEDYIESAEKSWQNYLYMRSRLKSPKKLTPVFHYGESFEALKRILDYRDENGDPIPYIGISPANDSGQTIKDAYLREVYDFIARSSNPKVKTHLYGMTSIKGIAKIPCTSADSTSHRLLAAYSKVRVPKYGIIGISKKRRNVVSNDNISFEDVADEKSVQEVRDYFASLGTTFEEVRENSNLRAAINMYTIWNEWKNNPYDPSNQVRNKKLFSLVV